MRAEYARAIVVRQGLDFGLMADDIPKYWFDGCPYKTRVMDAVQTLFPDGERYFISSVRNYRDRVVDPDMLKAVKAFTLQEGQHGMVHALYNQRLARQGIQTERFTGQLRWVTDWCLTRLPETYNLALTSAFEHFTAMMADLFFTEKRVMNGADPRIRALFAWHAIEEMEHRAVTFDVMQKVAHVAYFVRALAMLHATLYFTTYAVIVPWLMLKTDGLEFGRRLGLYAKGMIWQLGPRHGVFRRLMPMVALYFRPSFHPNRQKTVHNYGAWIEAYATSRDPIVASEAMYVAAYGRVGR